MTTWGLLPNPSHFCLTVPFSMCVCFRTYSVERQPQALVHVLTWVCVCQASQQSSPQAVWVVPALRQLHEITRSFIKQTYQKQDKVTGSLWLCLVWPTCSTMQYSLHRVPQCSTSVTSTAGAAAGGAWDFVLDIDTFFIFVKEMLKKKLYIWL